MKVIFSSIVITSFLLIGSALAFDNSEIMTFSHPQSDAISKHCRSVTRVVNEANSDDPYTGILSASCEGDKIKIEVVGLQPVRKKTFVWKVYDSELDYCSYVTNVKNEINNLKSPEGTITASVSQCSPGRLAVVKITVIRVR